MTPPALNTEKAQEHQVAMVKRRSGYDIDTGSVPWSPASPLSPTTTIVRRAQKAQPNIAVVHKVSLKDGVEGSVPRTASTPEIIPRPSSSGANRSAAELMLAPRKGLVRRSTLPADMPSVSRSFSAAAIGEMNHKAIMAAAQDGDEIRVLEPWEVKERSQNAVDYWRQAKAINRRSRTIEDTECLLADARKRQSEKGFEDALPTRARSKENSGPAIPKLPNQPEEVKPEDKKDEPPKKMSFAERMGYGVKPTQAEEKFATAGVVATASVKMKNKMPKHMVGVEAGNNTLYERLGKRRATIQ